VHDESAGVSISGAVAAVHRRAVRPHRLEVECRERHLTRSEQQAHEEREADEAAVGLAIAPLQVEIKERQARIKTQSFFYTWRRSRNAEKSSQPSERDHLDHKVLPEQSIGLRQAACTHGALFDLPLARRTRGTKWENAEQTATAHRAVN
jgi:hypothetical protein